MRNTPPTQRRIRSAHESKSASVRAAAAAPSRRQQSRWQREQQQQRTLYIGIAVMVVLIAAIFVGGVIYDNVIRANQVVAQIGPDSITASQLLDEVRPQARQLDAQAKQVGGGANVASYVDQQKRALPDQVLNDLIDQHIIQQEADRRGLSVSSAELDDKERQTIADFQAATSPTPEATATPESGAASDTGGQALTSATPEVTTLPLAATVNALTTPTAVPTLEDTAYGTALQSLLDRNNLTESDLRKQLQQNMLRDKVSAAVGQDQVPDNQDQVHLRQIQVSSADQANALLTQLQSGADFAQLAQQNSTDSASKDNGGDMGWVWRGGTLTKTLQDAAFALQPGQLSEVIQDANGFHILQVVDRDPSRPVPPDQETSLRQKAFTDWLSNQRSSSNVKLQLEQAQKDWVLSRIGIRP
jgi:parvulin-like peptidyl-prolyl isomerase